MQIETIRSKLRETELFKTGIFREIVAVAMEGVNVKECIMVVVVAAIIAVGLTIITYKGITIIKTIK